MANGQGMEVCDDTVFICGLPEDTTEDQLAEHFGQIGVIKFDKKNECKKIWVYKDKVTGKGKGEATITYDDPHTATSAIAWFNGKEFRGSTLSIELAQRKATTHYSRGGGGSGFRGGRGRFDGGGRSGGGERGGAGPGRPGDWVCPTCTNNNFAYRQECNRCKTQKPQLAGGGGGGGGSHYNGGRNYDGNSRGGGYGSRGGYGHGDNRERGRDNRYGSDRERDRDRDRNRDRDGYGGGDRNRDRDTDRDRSGSGPSRNNLRDDRRRRPY